MKMIAGRNDPKAVRSGERWSTVGVEGVGRWTTWDTLSLASRGHRHTELAENLRESEHDAHNRFA